jgi:undecaprenyl-diphosphatase
MREPIERAAVPILHAIVLGLVQGFTEFLPISSSGHLLLVPWLFGWDDFESTSVEKAFDVALHIGTLFAVVGYFRHDLSTYVRAGARQLVTRQRPATDEARLAWLLVLATVPAAMIGAVFSDTIDENLGTPFIIALSLIAFGLLLAWADRRHGVRPIEDMRTRDAVVVGVAQALALNPGTSRSGITMTAARFIGFNRETAVRISFLMSVPIIVGAVVFEVGGLVKDGIPDGLLVPMIVGIIASGLSGLLAVWGTLTIVRTYSFMPFVIYRIGLGTAILIILATGWRT